MSLRILLVEDDLTLRHTLQQALEIEGFLVDLADTVAGAKCILNRYKDEQIAMESCLLLVDLGLPDGDGADLINWSRSHSPIPVLVISARNDESSKVDLLDAGADDYLVKPFSINELKARIRVALRRQTLNGGAVSEDLIFGSLEISLLRRQVLRDGVKVHLTPKEFKLLARLLRQAGQVVTHRQLLQDVWGPDCVDHVHYLRLYMAQLRGKLERDPTAPELLLTETGVGYRFCEI
jgi:two-component system KDP operon response regulator KdpE